MDESISHFLSIAEISGVFLGFAALVSLVDRSIGEKRQELKSLLTNLVFISLLIIAASMFPLLLLQYGIVETLIWAVSAGIVFILNLCIIFYMSRLTFGWKAAHRRNPALSYVAWGIEPFFQIPLIFCILTLWNEHALAFYLTALVAALMQTSLLLANIVVLMLQDEDDV